MKGVLSCSRRKAIPGNAEVEKGDVQKAKEITVQIAGKIKVVNLLQWVD